MIHGMRLMALLAALLMVLVMACGGDDAESGEYLRESLGLEDRGPRGLQGAFGLPGAPGAPGAAATPAPQQAMAYAQVSGETVVVEKEVVREVPVEVVVEKAVVKEVETQVAMAVTSTDSYAAPTSDDSTDDQAALVSQRRIIVRTADLSLVVDDVSRAIDEVSRMAESMGGWVVSSDRSTKHSGFVSVRVPAESLEETIDELRELAVEVQSEMTTSKDVTDEYVDTTARLTNMQATQAALIRLLERAEKVEDALKVQNELTRVQEEIERLQGRIKFPGADLGVLPWST